MDEHALRVLEFGKVAELLAERARTAGGRELARALRPAGTAAEARARLEDTGEARRLLDAEGEPPFDGVGDLRPTVARAARGALLDPGELLALARTLAGARRLRRFLEARAGRYPRLAGLAAGMGDLRPLEEEIVRCLTPEGEVADEACPELAAARRRVRELEARLREQLEALARALRPYLQEPLVTVREDRFVLPVRQEFRGQVPGVVHDQSASGATLFVEPLSAVEPGNDLRRARADARRAEERVLADLSRAVGRQAGPLEATAAALARLDFVLACGRLSRDLAAAAPQLGEDGVVELLSARHPLLGERAVPLDIRLGRDFDTLVITGPNTGGKTVTLKTLGLLVLMAQAGLHIPAAPGSRVSFFRQVFADIGDEQSIEQSLSTFSAHMRNLVPIAARAGPGTLVLLDELGAGTDPAEGAALGMALLEHLQAAGARTACTTHLSELKHFAYARERMENASMEFDVDTLAPTFRLIVGLPGRSNAFEIASRLGLAPEVVRRARAFAGRGHERVDALLAAVERERRALAAEREEAERLRREVAGLAARLEREARALRERRAALLEEARRQARAVVEEARRQAADAVRRLREAAAGARAGGPAAAAALREAEAARQALAGVARALGEGGPEPRGAGEELPDGRPAGAAGGAPTVGRPVRVRGTDLRGILVGVTGGGRASVQAGSLRITVPLEDLVPAGEPSGEPEGGGEPRGGEGARVEPAGGGASRFQELLRRKAGEVPTEIHLRRLPVDEALARLDKYLDDAALAGLTQVRIVHGKGTGTLRRAVADFLRNHRLVEGFRPGGEGEGGAGVTVARLRASV